MRVVDLISVYCTSHSHLIRGNLSPLPNTFWHFVMTVKPQGLAKDKRPLQMSAVKLKTTNPHRNTGLTLVSKCEAKRKDQLFPCTDSTWDRTSIWAISNQWDHKIEFSMFAQASLRQRDSNWSRDAMWPLVKRRVIWLSVVTQNYLLNPNWASTI